MHLFYTVHENQYKITHITYKKFYLVAKKLSATALKQTYILIFSSTCIYYEAERSVAIIIILGTLERSRTNLNDLAMALALSIS